MEEEEDGDREYYVVNRAALKELGYDSCQGATLMYEDDKMRAQNPEAHSIVAVIDDYYDGHISAGAHPWYLWCDVALPVTCIRCHSVRDVWLR